MKIGLFKGNNEGRSSFERRKEHQTGNPREIVIEAEVETHAQVSQLGSLVHQRLAKYKIHGEWFNYGKEGILPYVELTKKSTNSSQRKTTLKWNINGQLSSINMVRIINALSVKALTECELACNRVNRDIKNFNLGRW